MDTKREAWLQFSTELMCYMDRGAIVWIYLCVKLIQTVSYFNFVVNSHWSELDIVCGSTKEWIGFSLDIVRILVDCIVVKTL